MALIRHAQNISKLMSSFSLPKPTTKGRNIVNLNLLSRNIAMTRPLHEEREVKLIFVKPNGEKVEGKGKVGDSVWNIAIQNGILKPFELCEGFLICHACHLVFNKADYERLPKMNFYEDDHLDLLLLRRTETSRSSCQIIMTEDLNGIEVKIPPYEYD